MLKTISKALSKVFGGNESTADTATTAHVTEINKQVIPEQEHNIPRRYLDDNALKVAYRLQDAGYEGYLVGGCIRDLLLKKNPKILMWRPMPIRKRPQSCFAAPV